MKRGGGSLVSIFILMLLLSPPGVAISEGIFDSQQFTRQIRLELKVAQVTKHPVLTRGPLDYLSEGGRKAAEENKQTELYQCKDRPLLTDEGTLANIAKEVASAPDYKIKDFKSKYYCYRFDILSYFIAKHQNKILAELLDAGFDEYFVSLEHPRSYEILYLLNQAVFAENKEALRLLDGKINTNKHLYFALLNFITGPDEDIDLYEEIKKREHKYRNRKVNHNDLVQAILHNNRYDLATVNEFIPKKSIREEYLKALNSLIDIRIRSKNKLENYS